MPLPLVYHPDYVVPLPPEHRFPMPKFGRIYDVLIRDRLVALEQFHTPEVACLAWLEKVHTSEYVQAFFTGTLEAKAQRQIGLPWSEALVKRTRAAIGGMVLTAQLALQHGLACNTAGGTHHAFPNYGSGFCVFNDLAIASKMVQELRLAKKILIVDLDMHQGDGYLKTLASHLPNLLTNFKPDLALYDNFAASILNSRVYFTITAIMTEQISQIGIMKAIGGKSGQILYAYLLTVLVCGLLPLMIAVPLGAISTYVAASFLINLMKD